MRPQRPAEILKHEYEFCLNTSWIMLVFAVGFLVWGLVWCIKYYSEYLWIGFILIALGIMFLAVFIITVLYVKRKLKELEEYEIKEIEKK